MDADGLKLTVRTPEARRIAESVKPDKEYTIEIKEFRRKRSLDQNALYWKCVGMIAEGLNASSSYIHNMLLRRYGQLETYGEGEPIYIFLPDTEAAQTQADEAESYHLKPTSHVKQGKDKDYRGYMLLRGSSTYTVTEMRRLLDGAIDECKHMGIEVLSEYERELLANN